MSWLGNAWNGIKKGAQAVGNAIQSGVNWVGDQFDKAHDAVINAFSKSSAYKMATGSGPLNYDNAQKKTEDFKEFVNNSAEKVEEVKNVVDKVADAVVDDATQEGGFIHNVGDTLTNQNQAENNKLMMQAALAQMKYQTQSAERAMQFEAQQAQLNRDFQERMSNTSYQRAVADIKKAGLNPALAITNLSPSSTPSGSSASGFAQAGSKADVDTSNYAPEMLAAIGQILSGAGDLFGSTSTKIYKQFFK